MGLAYIVIGIVVFEFCTRRRQQMAILRPICHPL
jgi:hypothetical protein